GVGGIFGYPLRVYYYSMSHIHENPKKLLTRVRRIGGQVSALEKSLEGGADCVDVLTQIAAVRGAMHGLMLEVLNAHLRAHVADEPEQSARTEEVEAVARLMKSYFK
ncbi:metal/formaldehyde-sensitive transcriptional repressor, partial [Xanthomonas hortorum]